MGFVGNGLIFEHLNMRDAYDMRSWGTHDTILLSDYNFPYINDEEIKQWFRFKTFNIRNRYFSVRDQEDRLVGYIGIKDRNFFKKSSFLGIVFDPDNINKGLGTKALEAFLTYYFNEMNMKVMYLEVAEFNERAISVYRKLGFRATAYYLDMFADQSVDTSNPEFISNKSFFVIDGEKIYNYTYEMRLTKETFLARDKELNQTDGI
ncbi:MAG: GNAT family N-acetyltransferase [Gudongella sp.]|nr:GNAT family N-acetyltransferase [Gudongella sp.]